MNTRNIKSTHIIRGLAALIVVIYHAKFALWSGGKEYIKQFPIEYKIQNIFLFSIDMLSSCGKQCVFIFFLLSAFVITHTYNQKKSQLDFYLTRIIRIYLPYLASILFSTLILFISVNYLLDNKCDGVREFTTRIFFAYENLSFKNLLYTLIFIENKEYFGFNPVYWSLLHEAIFYIFFPFYNRLKNIHLLLLASLILLFSFFYNIQSINFQIYFLLGIFIYRKLYIEKKFIRVKNIYFYVIIIFSYILLNILVNTTYTIFADFFVIVIFIILINQLMYNDLKISKIFHKLSDYSFSIYLYHLPLLLIIFSILSHITGKCIFYSRMPYYIGSVLALLLSIPFYYLIEKPSLMLIKKYFK